MHVFLIALTMNETELMTVEDTFMVESIGLLLVPLFEVPYDGKWEDISEDLAVLVPNKEMLLVRGQFRLTHFNINDAAVSVGERWKIQLVLKNVSSESVPIGSIVYSSQETRNTLVDAPG